MQLVRETMRQEEALEPEFLVERVDGRARVTLDAIDARGRYRNSLRPEVELAVDDEEPRTVELAQVAPGRYAATVPLSDDQSAVLRWSDPQDDEPEMIERRLHPVASAESLPRAPDTGLLRAIAEQTGGRFDPPVGNRTIERRVERPTSLWPPFAVAALLLYLVNMLLRRVRLFDRDRWASA